MKRLTLHLDPELWQRVHQACLKRQLTAPELVTGLLLRQLHRWEREEARGPQRASQATRR